MSKSAKAIAIVALTALMPVPASAADKVGLGRVALPEEIKAWDIDVRPDGVGLPDGKGSVSDGEALFQTKCSSCHGEFGEGAGRWPVLAGGQGSLKSDRPEKTIGSFWPYTSTVYDYIHRAMPFGEAQSLSPDETYALTAYLMNLNDLVPSDFVLSKENFPKNLPNEKNFYDDDRETTEKAFWKKDPCMANCKERVEITNHARILDVTPDDQKDDKDQKPSAGVE
ncbi:c-type cytochrome [Hansschlegelia zhihuaiae]|uniref:Cytochrome c n=1 Tax=Hansschlegelia zhihuaiae TaxID=405005 RepID=A0A4Q0MAS6_9HYPH|nr:cytochrome c [Hansschlegelia zhihuaiae]RXF69886.1 cytochrome c [Hansschlegelia zhihuaiae]